MNKQELLDIINEIPDMDEVDKDMMLGEYDWCESINEEE